MKIGLFKIKFNHCNYDQYDAFIVRAKDKGSVIELIRKAYPQEKFLNQVDYEGGYEIIELDNEGEDEIILGSFNAG